MRRLVTFSMTLLAFLSFGCGGKRTRNIVVYFNDTLLTREEYFFTNCHSNDSTVQDGDLMGFRHYTYVLRSADTLHFYANGYSRDLYIMDRGQRKIVSTGHESVLKNVKEYSQLSELSISSNIQRDLAAYVWNHSDKSHVYLSTYMIDTIPQGARYLGITVDSMKTLHFTLDAGLRYLNLAAYDGAVDIASIAKLHNLKILEVYGDTIRCSDASVVNRSVRVLSLSHLESGDVSVVQHFPGVAAINLQSNFVRDLSNLSTLQDVVEIDANDCPIAILPMVKFRKLQHLTILNNTLKIDAIRHFSELNPNCQVDYRWTQKFMRMTNGTNRIVIHGIYEYDTTKYHCVVADSLSIKNLRNVINIDDTSSGYKSECLCAPWLEVTFYHNTDPLLAFGLHGENSLTIYGFPGRAVLMKDSEKKMCEWFLRYGIKEPKKAFFNNNRLSEHVRI